MLARLAGCLGVQGVSLPPRSGGTRPAKVLGCFPARCGPPADHTAPPHALQEAARHHGSPDAALTSPAPAPPLPPADSLPLAAGSLAFAVPPSLDAALEVLAAHHPASPKVAHGDAVTETAAACAAGLRRWAQSQGLGGMAAGHVRAMPAYA